MAFKMAGVTGTVATSDTPLAPKGAAGFRVLYQKAAYFRRFGYGGNAQLPVSPGGRYALL